MDRIKLGIRVDSRIDADGEKIPRRLHIEGQATDIIEVLDRWMDGTRLCFKVLDDEGGMYVIGYDPDAGGWELIMMEQG